LIGCPSSTPLYFELSLVLIAFFIYIIYFFI
jgi:hypothetical protein